MLASKTIKLILALSIASSIIVFFAGFINANKSGISEVEPMAQKPDKDSKENRASEVKPIKLPDEIWKEIEERDEKAQQKRNEDQARELAKKAPKEREEIEKEIRKERETKHALERRTEEELKQEDERLMKQLEKMRSEGQY
ncbi:hypothetical protein [Myxacorys almedinensis]|uniref:Uncharacterized protein n=1 Tax=Myxacorys almedinensis A TaxID=2690445 RepID=A0A8J7YW69_9CYAN|nr:hypothetical protein [Myxacorys almedinensis]NDJ15792.1 hypothetical protein [Myxacorys almedinensis A]